MSFEHGTLTERQTVSPRPLVPPWPRPSPGRAARLSVGVPLLREATEDAEEAGRDSWEFALTIDELFAAGLRGADLRWLVAHGLATHATEHVGPRKGRRQFRSVPELALTNRSCFVLTPLGRRFAEAPPEPLTPRPRPCWDAAARELRWRGLLVKQFRTPARSQELILSVFEEEGWPGRIDDPLAGSADQDPHQRLHDVVRRLNGNQRDTRLLFNRDGTGKGICWTEATAPGAPPPRRLGTLG